jgi:PKD repeat protein
MSEGFIVLVLIGVLVAFLVAPVLTPPPIAHFEILNPQQSYVAPAIISVVSKTENVARLEWDFGDGTKVLNEKATTHTYCFDSDEARVFTIKLTVWDRFGRTSQASKDVTITPAPAPTVRAIQTNPPIAGVLEPLTVLRCSAEVEQWGGPDIVVNSYEWILMKRGSPNIVQKQTGKKCGIQVASAKR